jgi:hypothetical protein
VLAGCFFLSPLMIAWFPSLPIFIAHLSLNLGLDFISSDPFFASEEPRRIRLCAFFRLHSRHVLSSSPGTIILTPLESSLEISCAAC